MGLTSSTALVLYTPVFLTGAATSSGAVAWHGLRPRERAVVRGVQRVARSASGEQRDFNVVRGHAGANTGSHGDPGGQHDDAVTQPICALVWVEPRGFAEARRWPAGTADATGLRTGLASACEWNVHVMFTVI